VDDEEDALQWMQDFLTQEGHQVVGVESGLQALAALDVGKFDVMLLDLMMPEVDGYQVLRSMTDHWVNSRVPVVITSCRRDPRSRSFAKIFGVSRYLEKPFEPRQLMEALRDIDEGREELAEQGN
jgi:two-component system OmpR family response regulator